MSSDRPPTDVEASPPPEAERITLLLRAAGAGRATRTTALEELMPLVYGHLRRLARRHLMRERPGHTLDSVALVSEAFLRLNGGQQALPAQSRSHFFGVASRVMRQILVDHARAQQADKRGGGERNLTLDERREIPADSGTGRLLELDAAITELEAVDPEASRVVELRFFAGATEEEAAEALGLSPATARRRWAFAKAWLRRALDEGP